MEVECTARLVASPYRRQTLTCGVSYVGLDLIHRRT